MVATSQGPLTSMVAVEKLAVSLTRLPWKVSLAFSLQLLLDNVLSVPLGFGSFTGMDRSMDSFYLSLWGLFGCLNLWFGVFFF